MTQYNVPSLIDNFGWNHLRRYVKNTNNMNHRIKVAKNKQQRNTFNINFCINISCDLKEAMVFDADNGKTNWKDDELLSQSKYTTSVLLNTFFL